MTFEQYAANNAADSAEVAEEMVRRSLAEIKRAHQAWAKVEQDPSSGEVDRMERARILNIAILDFRLQWANVLKVFAFLDEHSKKTDDLVDGLSTLLEGLRRTA